MKKNKARRLTGAKVVGLLRYIPLYAWLIFWVFALGWIVLASLSTTKEIFTNDLIGSGIRFSNYVKAWRNNNVSKYFMNSVIITCASCALVVLVSVPAAYVLAKKTFLGRKLVLNGFVVGMSIPSILLVIPIYIVFVKAGLLGSIASLIFLYTVFNIPYTVFFLTSFFSTVPTSLAEAGMIDGCTESGAMWRIMMPMASPGIITVTIFNFMGIWNEYFMALIFGNGNDDIRTLTMGLQNLITAMTFSGDWAGLFASVMIVFLPTFILYLFLSEKIIAGITGGGVKG